eukprot:COSAG06_NODE_11753_length_1468_cov_35.415632_3_plen_82_part_00
MGAPRRRAASATIILMAQQPFEFEASSLLADPSAASASFEEHGVLVLRRLFVRTACAESSRCAAAHPFMARTLTDSDLMLL